MLFQLLIDHPRTVMTIVQRTPPWVWGLLAALMLLGAIQMRTRSIGPMRATLLPLGLAAFSLSGVARDLSASPWVGPALAMWFLMAMTALLAGWHTRPPAGTRYEPATRRIHLPGSVTPMLVILAIFLLKYTVGVELAMQPMLGMEAGFALGLGGINGALSGLVATRSAAIWRLTCRHTTA